MTDAGGQPSTAQQSADPMDEPRSNRLLEAALDWADKGFSVFPCRNQPGKPGHKAPLTAHSFKDATVSRAQIEAWWSRHPEALIGMPTGRTTGVAVLDLDLKNNKDGYAAIPDWRRLTPVISQTASGGAHLYFRANRRIRCTTGKDGVDVRGDGGYVIVPPSPGYIWLDGHDLADLPEFPAAYLPADHIGAPSEESEASDVAMFAAALRAIPNDDEDYETWVRIGMATWAATGGNDAGLSAWDEWSSKSCKYCSVTTTERWEAFHRSPPSSIGAGTVFFEADQADPSWRWRYNAEADRKAQEELESGFVEFCAQFGLGSAFDDRPSSSAENVSSNEASGQSAALSALGEWNAGTDDFEISPRGWLLGNVFCRRFTSSLIADGGVGKTAVRVAQALSLATGRNLTGEHVFQRCRVLYVSLEDDRDELRRRVLAAMMHHGITNREVDGWLFLAAPEGKAGKLVTASPQTRRAKPDVLKLEIEKTLIAHRIDLVILDPLVKAHDVEENDNSAMDVVIQTLSELAVKFDVAVDVPHHTSKGAADPGNADRGRGASAVKNGARLVYTLTQMSADEANRFGIEEGERRSYVRVDSGKVNIAPLHGAQWFKIVSVPLGNGTAIYPNGDRVQTVDAWTPPDTWEGLENEVLEKIIADIDRGVPPDPEKGTIEGSRYSSAPRTTTRAAWEVVQRHMPAKNEKQCRDLVSELVKKKYLTVRDYRDPNDRRTVKGLFAAAKEEAAEPI